MGELRGIRWQARLAALLVLVLSASGCGSRRTPAELQAALEVRTVEVTSSSETVDSHTPPDTSSPPASVEDPATQDRSVVGQASPAPSSASTGTATPEGRDPQPPAGPAGEQPSPAAPVRTDEPPQEREPVRIGSVGPLSGLAGTTLGPGVDGLRVWVQWINDRGGLNGHPVELFVEDDRADPSRHRSLVQELVDARGVVAFVHNGEALSGAGSISFHQERRIPVIGSEGAAQYFYEQSMYFPQMSHGEHLSVMGLGAFATWARANDTTRFGAILCQEAQICDEAARLNEAHAEDFGMELVYQGRASLAKPDFTAECLNAQRAGVELLAIGMDVNSMTRIAASCARQGYFPAYATSSSGAAPKHAADENIPVLVLSSPVASSTLDQIDAVAEFREALSTYAPDVTPQLGHVTGWASGKLLERAAAQLAEPTSEEILEGLWSIDGEDLGGLTSPLRFRRDEPARPATCWWTVVAQDGEYSSPFGPDTRCTDVLGAPT